MNFRDCKGLFRNIMMKLSADEMSLLDASFNTLHVEACGYKVANPGEKLLSAFFSEDMLDIHVVDKFHDIFIDLLRSALAGNAPLTMCCPFHRSKIKSILSNIAPSNITWLTTFLEILTAISDDIHFKLNCEGAEIGKKHQRLSRLVPLKRFIEVHTDKSYCVKNENIFKQEFDPIKYSQSERLAKIHACRLGKLRGVIGSYPSYSSLAYVGDSTYLRYCPSIKPFATFTDNIDKSFPDRNNPAELLKNLGLAFKGGWYFIEMIYDLEDACFTKLPSGRPHIGVPTCIESAGNWAFRPDRTP